MIPDLLLDVRYSLRSLLRAPVWTMLLVFTIALGAGSTASVQGFVRGLITTDLPIPAIDTAVSLFGMDDGGTGPLPFATIAALGERRDVFEALAAVRESQERVTIGDRASLMTVAVATPDIGAVFPITVRHGVVVSHELRSAGLRDRVDVIGTSIKIGRGDLRVAEVAPYWLEGLYRGHAIDIWMPIAGAADQHRDSFWSVGRLRPGVSVAAAQAAIDAAPLGGTSIVVVPYTGLTPEAAGGMRRIRALLLVAANAVFLIACANVAAFLLARATARARETAVRVAIGARARQLARQLLVDSVLLTAIGGVTGLILARWMADIVPLLFFDQDADRLVFAPDFAGIAWTSAACAALTIACGLAPLLATRRIEPAAVLQREIAGPSRIMTRVNAGLIMIQMTVCTVLVISTGLLLQGFERARQTRVAQQLGEAVLVTAEARPRASRQELAQGGLEYFAAIESAARSTVDVSAAGWVARLPGTRPSWQWLRFEPPVEAHDTRIIDAVPFTAASLDVIEMPPISGRLFGGSDSGACGAAIVNETAAAMLFADEAVGRSLETDDGRPVEIIGVVASKAPAKPLLFVYPQQAPPLGLQGPSIVHVPPRAELAGGLLDVNIVSTNFFAALGLELIDGERFTSRLAACRVGIVNEEAAARFFAGKAVGGAVIDDGGRRTSIIGVVRTEALGTAQRRIEPALYLPVDQDFLPRMTAVLQTTQSGRADLVALKRRLVEVPGGRSDRLTVVTMADHLNSTTLAPERIASVLVAVFAAIALALGAIGLYGVMADAARCRRREFAVRIALGAQAWRVVKQVMLEGGRLVVADGAIGMIGSLALAQWLARITPGAGVPSLWVWLAPPVLLAGAVVMASVIPARRALTVNLQTIMRDV